jgi:putative DNA primase/helicase
MNKTPCESPHLRLVAIAEDEATGEFIVVIEFRDLDGRIRRIDQPRSTLRKIDQLKEALENAGAYLSSSDRESRHAIHALSIAAEEAERWKYAKAVGWYDGHRAFVLPDRVIGRPLGGALIFPPRTRPGDHRFELTRKGSHKDWVRDVAEPSRYSSSMVLGICMTLAAPLLGFSDFHPFGILLSAPSKSAKSTALVAAGSIMGFAREQDLPNFRSTDTAFGELPAVFNDMLMPINELGLLKGRATDRHQRMRDLSYGFAEGRGTTYSTFASQGDGQRGYKWRSLGFATGEETLDQISMAAGESRAMGESIRWCDLPGNTDGANDIFDRCPKSVSANDRQSWVKQQCKALRRAAADNHGVALEHYIKRVIKRRRTISARLQPLIDEFVNAAVADADAQAVHHLASSFGLIRAGGILGVRLGTLPYSEKFVHRCIMRCYRAARRRLRTESDLLRAGLCRLRAKLKSSNMLKAAKKKRWRSEVFKTEEGYMKKSNVAYTVTIRAEKFKKWFDDPRQPALVLQWLKSKNALPSKPTLPTKPGNAIVWAESQPEWPDGSRPRSIVIELRHGLLDQIKA